MALINYTSLRELKVLPIRHLWRVKNIEKFQSMITHAGRARFREVSTIILCLGNISKFRQVVTKEKHSQVEVRPYKYEVLFG